VLWSIRPERVTISDSGGLTGTLTDLADVGTAFEVFIAINDGLEVQARTSDEVDLDVGDECHIELPLDAISVWPMAEPGAEAPPSALLRPNQS